MCSRAAARVTLLSSYRATRTRSRLRSKWPRIGAARNVTGAFLLISAIRESWWLSQTASSTMRRTSLQRAEGSDDSAATVVGRAARCTYDHAEGLTSRLPARSQETTND